MNRNNMVWCANMKEERRACRCLYVSQATLARPPSTYTAMMNGIYVAYGLIVAGLFWSEYSRHSAAFGNTINPDILLSISKPDWLIKAANLMVVVHVAASFQVSSPLPPPLPSIYMQPSMLIH